MRNEQKIAAGLVLLAIGLIALSLMFRPDKQTPGIAIEKAPPLERTLVSYSGTVLEANDAGPDAYVYQVEVNDRFGTLITAVADFESPACDYVPEQNIVVGDTVDLVGEIQDDGAIRLCDSSIHYIERAN